jgi:predicted NBD/HSP70 family sugar kinase
VLGRTATASLLRELNELTVLEAIRRGHPVSRAEISRRVGISKPTVSLALQSLLDAGLVRQTTPRESGTSYGALFFEPVPDAAFVLGLDVGGRYLRGALADLTGEIRAREDVEVAHIDADGVVGEAKRLRDRLVSTARVSQELIDGAVVGAPGVVNPADGRIWQADNVPGLEGFPIVGELSRALGLPTTVENDVNLAALGEHWAGAGRDVTNFAFLSIGTGIGCGLILRGELHRGARGAAGEIDYAVEGGVDSPNNPSGGLLACMIADQIAAADVPTVLSAPASPEEVFAAARDGDIVGLRIVAEEARRIAAYVAPIAAVVDVELVVLGGGVGLNGDLLLEPVRAELAKRLPYPPRLEISALGAEPVLSGALAVGVRAALENVVAKRMRRQQGMAEAAR